MALSHRTAKFALRQTTDPDLAAELVDQLLSDLSGARPIVGLPPLWVLAKQHHPIEVAVFAVDHCEDAATLATIASSATEPEIVAALARNPHLDEATLRALRTRPIATDHNGIRAALMARPAPEDDGVDDRFALFMAHMTAHPNLWDTAPPVLIQLRDVAYPLPTNKADAVLDELAERDLPWGATILLMTSTRRASAISKSGSEGFTNATYAPLEYLDRLSPATQVAALEAFIPILTTVQVTPVERPLAERLVKVSPPPTTLSHSRSTARTYTDEAVEVLLAEPRWHPALCFVALSDDQITRLYSSLDPALRVTLLDRRPLERITIELVLADLPPGSLDRNTVPLDLVLDRITGPDDPLLEKLLVAGAPKLRTDYLRGAWADRDHPVAPTVEILEAALRADPTCTGPASRKLDYDIEDYPDHVAILLELVPGLAWHTIEDTDVAACVYQRLLATGAPLELVLHQFDAQAERTTLEHLCAALRGYATLHG